GAAAAREGGVVVVVEYGADVGRGRVVAALSTVGSAGAADGRESRARAAGAVAVVGRIAHGGGAERAGVLRGAGHVHDQLGDGGAGGGPVPRGAVGEVEVLAVEVVDDQRGGAAARDGDVARGVERVGGDGGGARGRKARRGQGAGDGEAAAARGGERA